MVFCCPSLERVCQPLIRTWCCRVAMLHAPFGLEHVIHQWRLSAQLRKVGYGSEAETTTAIDLIRFVPKADVVTQGQSLVAEQAR